MTSLLDGLLSRSLPPSVDLSVTAAWYVDAIKGSDANDGRRWGTAFATLAAAISAASAGDLIQLAGGSPSLPAMATINKALTIRGGGEANTTLVHPAGWTGKTLNITAAGVTLERLSIDATAATLSSGNYALDVNAADFTGRELTVNGNRGVIFRSTAPRARWLDCHSPVYALGAVDGTLRGCSVNHTSTGGTNTQLAFLDTGSHRWEIGNSRFWNTTTDNAGQEGDAIRLNACNDVTVNSVRLFQSSRYGVIAKGCDGLEMSNVRAVGSATLRADAASTISGVQLYGCTGFRLVNVRAKNQGGYGFAIVDNAGVHSSDGILDDCHGEVCGDPAFAVLLSDRVTFKNCSGKAAGFALTIGEGTPFAAASTNPCTAINVLDCEFDDCSTGGILVQGSSGCLIDGVRFHNCVWATNAGQYTDAYVTLCDGATAGSVGNRVKNISASRDASTIGGASVQGGATAPTAAQRPTRLPKYMVRSTTFGTYYLSTLTGHNEYEDIRVGAVSRGDLAGTAMSLTSTDKASRVSYGEFEQIHAFDTAGSIGGTDTQTMIEGAAAAKVTMPANGTDDLDYAISYDFTKLPDTAAIEVAMWSQDANLASIDVRLAHGAADTNSFLLGTITKASMESGWYRQRFYLGDIRGLTAAGDATIANLDHLRFKITAGAGGSAVVEFDDFGVVWSG